MTTTASAISTTLPFKQFTQPTTTGIRHAPWKVNHRGWSARSGAERKGQCKAIWDCAHASTQRRHLRIGPSAQVNEAAAWGGTGGGGLQARGAASERCGVDAAIEEQLWEE